MAARATIQLTEPEQELLRAVLAAETFRETAWHDYGEEWTEHIPQAVNAFCQYYFGTLLPTWVLALYYCPQPEATVHGGRGSAKTISIGIAMAIYHTIHPGEPWLHVSPVKDQAARTYEGIMFWGNRALGHPNWCERFVDSTVTAPFHEIRLKSWSEHDPGNIFRFRPMADDVEYLRSMEAGTITVDEAFRATPNPDIYPQLRGCIRGINQVRKAMLPAEIGAEIDAALATLTREGDPKKRKKLDRKLTELYEKYRLNRRGFLALYGNVAGWDWEWERYGLGETDPEHYLSLTVTTYDNPYLGGKSVEDLERTYGSNTQLREIEMLAKRPMNLGGIFVSLEYNLDARALPAARSAMIFGEALVEEQAPFGIFHYELPPDPTHFYVVGADPGSGIAPGRNKWVILTYDAAERPIRLVYFRMGNVNRRVKGDITPFWDELKHVSRLYPHYPGDIWIEATANQKGQAQLAMPEDIGVTAVSLSTTKPVLINQLRMLMDRHLFALPAIPVFLQEHGNYELPDTDLTQDIVMANICAAGALWRYVDLEYDLRNMGAPDVNPNHIQAVEQPQRYGRPPGLRQRQISPFMDALPLRGAGAVRAGNTGTIWQNLEAGLNIYVGQPEI